MAVMMITHNLGVIAETAEQVAIMYLGRIVECATASELFSHPLHPYTAALLKSIPVPGTRRRRLESIRGAVPDPFHMPSGCTFHPRCPHAMADRCPAAVPALVEVSPAHQVRCYLCSAETEDG